MAWLTKRGNVFHLGFRYSGRIFRTSLKTADRRTANAAVARVDENIRLIERGRLTLPEDVPDLPTFLLSDGNLNSKPMLSSVSSLSEVLDAYAEAMSNGSMEANSLSTIRIHMKHLQGVLGSALPIRSLSFADLQKYVDSRAKQKGRRNRSLSPTTIKKELATLRAIWSWALKHDYVCTAFPGKGLRFPKADEKPRFQTWKEIEHQLRRGALDDDEQAELWDCLFLTLPEITELLSCASQQARHDFIYPMVATAAYTGARRSELVRAQVRDFDLEAGTVTLREKKRNRQKYTTRTVPLAKGLSRILTEWFDRHPGGKHAFCLGNVARSRADREHAEPLTVDQAHDHLKRTLSGTRWSKVRGWHVLRHSFASNCAAKGVDQRLINAWMGHQTEDMMKRYQHLFPDSQQQAIQSVFERQ
ncbi:tyrosine-type recombinase/integrase [bacterium]|nr:tyrosine-type recombinase/integrase [bacterium]